MTLSAADLAALDPDVLLIKPCGCDLGRTGQEIDRFPAYLPWQEWRAVAAGRVFIAGGNAYFNRSGPRLEESAEILAGCVHQAAFAGPRELTMESNDMSTTSCGMTIAAPGRRGQRDAVAGRG